MPSNSKAVADHEVIIVGAGFAGVAVAVELRKHGITDFRILERADDVGGVWRDNNYPGCSCDIPSALYSYSFRPKTDWSGHYGTQPEIWQYLRDCVTEFEIADHIDFGQDVVQCQWDDDQSLWTVTTADAVITTRLLVSATGSLNEPLIPKFENRDAFAGTSFHSAEWPHDFDPSHRRIAVIGTGASAVQFVPEIVDAAHSVTVFQRTPPWVMPRADGTLPSWLRELWNSVPGKLPLGSLLPNTVGGTDYRHALTRKAQYLMREFATDSFAGNGRGLRAMERIAERHLHSQVEDPQLRAVLEPDYRIGCKRVLFSDDWYPALQKPNVELITDPIADLAAGGVITQAGGERTLHHVDTIIYGTGFQISRLPFLFRIRNSTGTPLAYVWAASRPGAYLGTTVAGFPNLALMTGPNTGLASSSMLLMIESQARYVRQMALHLHDNPGALQVKPDIQDRYLDDIERRLESSVWSQGGCSSWYQDSSGRVTAMWPGRTAEFDRRTRQLRLSDYTQVPAGT